MKKILLGLFLILGVVSFAAPEYVDVKGMEKSGYIISGNKKDSLLAFKLTQKDRIAVTLYFANDEKAEYIRNTFKRSAPSAMEFLDESENNRAYCGKKSKSKWMLCYNLFFRRKGIIRREFE